MTRYLPNLNGPTANGLVPGARPPLEALPKELADVLRECDRIRSQRAEAQAHAASLNEQRHETTAEQVDAEAAVAAARQGKKIPAPVAVPRLRQDREDAARAVAAFETAYTAVTAEAEDMKGKLFWASDEKVKAARAKARIEVEAAANKLADLVETAVAAGAVHDWLRTGRYIPDASTWPTEAVDLDRYGLDRNNTTPIPVRAILVRAATTVLED